MTTATEHASRLSPQFQAGASAVGSCRGSQDQRRDSIHRETYRTLNQLANGSRAFAAGMLLEIAHSGMHGDGMASVRRWARRHRLIGAFLDLHGETT